MSYEWANGKVFHCAILVAHGEVVTKQYWWADTLVCWIRMDCSKRALCSKVAVAMQPGMPQVAVALRLNDCSRAAAVAMRPEVHATRLP